MSQNETHLSPLIYYQWEIFIVLEVLSFIFLFAFIVLRYITIKQKLSHLFLVLFFVCMVFEVALAFQVYRVTGELSTFQIVIGIFLIYACTFGISDFKKLDRYIKGKIEKWRGVQLLTEEDLIKMKQAKDPKVIARKNRIWWFAHAAVFVIAHFLFWQYYGSDINDFSFYLTDITWWEEEGFENGPFQDEMIDQISKIWTIIFGLDTIISWSYTFFPSKGKR